MVTSTRLFAAVVALAALAGCSCDPGGSTRGTGPLLEIRRYEQGSPPAEGVLVEDNALIDLGRVNLNHAPRVFLAIRNGGSLPMKVEEPRLEKGLHFRLEDVLLPCSDRAGAGGDIPVGDCSTLVVRLDVPATGPYEDVLTVKSDDGHRPEARVRFAAVAARGALQVCVSSAVGSDRDLLLDQCSSSEVKDLSVDFGIVGMGAGDMRRRAQLTNQGDSDLDVSSVAISAGDPPDFWVDPAGFRAVLKPLGSAEVGLLFKPLDAGPRLATVVVSADDRDTAPVRIHLVAMGDAAKLCIDPGTLEFGDVGLGRTVTLPIQVGNCGTKPLSITALNIEAEPDYTLTAPSISSPFQPNEMATAQIHFTPSGLGPKVGRLRVTSTDLLSPESFALLRGNAVPSQDCKLEASSAVLDFGTQQAGGTVKRTLTLHNSGGAWCHVSSMAVDATGLQARFLIDSGPLMPAQIAPNDLIDVRLAYNPLDGAGPDTGALLVQADDPSLGFSPLSVALRGTPTPQPQCALNISPAAQTLYGRQINFGTVVIGDQKAVQVLMKNVGSADCTFQAPRMGPLTETAFSFGTHLPTLPSRISPGNSQTVEVMFAPKGQSVFPSMMNFFTIQTNDGQPDECPQADGCKKIAMAGSGVLLAIDFVPGTLDFGLVTVGCNSVDRTTTIYNVGGAPVTLSGFDIDPTTAPFRIVNRPTTPYPLNPGASVPVTVRYRPEAAAADSALLVISHNYSGGTSTVPLKGAGTAERHQADQFRQNGEPKTDVLWVIDNSGSMSDKQGFLAANAQTFVNQANATRCDYKLAVTTVEWSGTGSQPFPHRADSDSAFPGSSIFPGEFFGTPKVILRTDADPAAELARNIRVGNCCADSAESGLEGAKAALSNPLLSDPTKPNSAFLRDDAKLAVILLSDEEDQGGSSNVQYYVDFFQNLKGARNTQMFAWHSIVGEVEGGCTADIGGVTIGAEYGKRYVEVSARTGGIVRSICSNDWGRIASDIGLDAFAARTQFFLTRSADGATLAVTVDGVPSAAGVDFDFDSVSNSVIFRTASLPGPGAAIRAEYDTLCL